MSGLRTAQVGITDPELGLWCQHLLTFAQTALKDVRRLSLGLRPSMLDDLGLIPALERSAADNREHYPIDLKLDPFRLVVRFSGEVETTVFRIVQEAIANVV